VLVIMYMYVFVIIIDFCNLTAHAQLCMCIKRESCIKSHYCVIHFDPEYKTIPSLKRTRSTQQVPTVTPSPITTIIGKGMLCSCHVDHAWRFTKKIKDNEMQTHVYQNLRFSC
jgi:hypothetical protein